MAVVHHILLAAAVLALGAAGLRVASLAAPRGLERVIAAAVLAAATAVVEVLLLGLVGLSDSSFVLAAAAGLTWLAARRAPEPELAPRVELAGWWAGLSLPGRLAVGALAGAWLVWQAWLLRFPTLGFDTVLYHLSESAVWATNGHAGGTDLVIRRLPVTNYPITDEVFMSWGLGLARSLVPASLMVPPQVALLGLSAWCGLRALDVTRLPRALGTAAVCAMPAVIGWQSNGALTDPASLAWLVACGALCVASRSRPLLVAPALVAGALAIGTKTTTAPLALVVLAAALWIHRARLRELWRPLLAAALLAVGCGGVWYLRNLIDHGSPLWPFVAAPWGTPLPPAMESANDSFAANIKETIDVVGDLYVDRFLGGIVLLAAALAAPLLAWRRRAVWLASAAAVVSTVLWARAPFTGVPPLEVRIPEGVFSTTRYLIPAVTAAVVALALAGAPAAGVPAWRRGCWAPAWRSSWSRPSSSTSPPSPRRSRRWPARSSERRWPGRSRRCGCASPPRPALVAGALALGALLAWPASGYLERHAQSKVFATGVTTWMAQQPDDDKPVYSAPLVLGPLAGDRLQRELVPIPRATDCAALRAQARRGYVLLYVGPPADRGVAALRRCMRRPPAFADAAFRVWAPGP